MNHLIIAYTGLLVIIGILTLVLLRVAGNCKNYYKPFFFFYMFFTLTIFISFLRFYFLVNISWTDVLLIHGSYGVTVLLNYALIYCGMLTLHRLYIINRVRLERIIIVILGLGALLIISPLSMEYIPELDSISQKNGYFFSILPYLSLLLYILFLALTKINIVKDKTDKIFVIIMGSFTVFGLIDTIISITNIIKNPIKKLDISEETLLISTIPFLVISIYVIIILLQGITSPKKNQTLDSLINKGYSPRESELIILVLDGLSNKDIAEKLCISIGTVKTHIHNIFKKSNVSNRFELAKKIENN